MSGSRTLEDRSKKLRVLLIAEAANPDWTSVPLVGWNLSRALAKVVDLHVVTQVRNRAAFLSRGLTEGIDFTAIDNEFIASPLHSFAAFLRREPGKGWTTGSAFASLAYYSFEALLWKKFEKRLAANEFDLVHRVTPLSPTYPSIIASRLSSLEIPFVLGPLNGGVAWPDGFRHRQYAENEWLSHVRWLHKFMPGYMATRKCSSAILVGSKSTLQEMPKWAVEKCVYIPENGIDADDFSDPRIAKSSIPVKAVFVGRLVPCKGVDLLIKAAESFLTRGDLSLDIVGDGPVRESLVELVQRLGLNSRVQFHGWVPHRQVISILKESDVLALPSIREFGGGVVVEAMALGVTPIVADYGGPSELVDDATGFRVPFTDEDSLIKGFKDVFEAVVRSPDVLNSRGAAARAKTLRELTWDAKAQKVFNVYNSVIRDQRAIMRTVGSETCGGDAISGVH